MAPKDESELRDMLYTAVQHTEGPVALRYPRGNGLGVPLKEGFEEIPIGKAEVLRTGHQVAILAIGDMVMPSLAAAEALAAQQIAAEVVNMRFVKPLDEVLLEDIAARFKKVVTVENNTTVGGFGSAVSEYIARSGHTGIEVRHHGLPDRFVDHGSPAELARELGLDAAGITRVVLEFLAGAD